MSAPAFPMWRLIPSVEAHLPNMNDGPQPTTGASVRACDSASDVNYINEHGRRSK